MVALAAVAGGVLEGCFSGAVFAVVGFLPQQLFDPSTGGGTGSAGLTASAVTVGVVIGGVSGGLVSVPAALGLLVAWALRLRPMWAVGLSTAALVPALGAFVFVLFPPDAELIVLAAVALAHAIAGLAVIDGLGRRWPDAQGRGSIR